MPESCRVFENCIVMLVVLQFISETIMGVPTVKISLCFFKKQKILIKVDQTEDEVLFEAKLDLA